MKESGFWRKLRPLMRAAAPGIVVERIESWSTPGFPDVSGCWNGRDFWLELKVERNGRVEMRPAQVRWLERRWAAGSHCYVLIYSESTTDLVLVAGDAAGELSKADFQTMTRGGVFSFNKNCTRRESIRGLLEAIYDGREI